MRKSITAQCFFCFLLLPILLGAGCGPDTTITGEFPDFITQNEDYYITRIDDVPEIDADTYRLEVTGLVDRTASYTLEELQGLELVELPLTVECIGNSAQGSLVGTAVWKGFKLYEFLEGLGLDESATGVKYLAADGFYASHTLEQIRDNQVLGALFMNGVPLPPVQGFPLRILNPGFYGAKQPAWVTQIEVIDRPPEDYWADRFWDVSPPMDVDSKFFFPRNNTSVAPGTTVEIGGSAYGGTRITGIDVTTDGGLTWQAAQIVESMDADNVWVFWETQVRFDTPGTYTLNSRATDMHGNVQPEKDPDSLDGTNSWPETRVIVEES